MKENGKFIISDCIGSILRTFVKAKDAKFGPMALCMKVGGETIKQMDVVD